jgi:predicted ATPase
MRATLDWSHDLLSEVERVILRRISVFWGDFTMDAAAAAAAGEWITAAGVF